MDKPGWPAYASEKRDLDRLRPYERNARKHSDAQLEQLAASMKEWGWTLPILVDENGMILAGVGRWLAATKLLRLSQGPVIVAKGWSEAQKRAYILADNRLAENSRWDDDLIAIEISELSRDGFDLALLGFSDKEIKKLDDDEEGLEVEEVDTSTVNDEFWIAIRGPLEQQGEAIERMQKAMEGLDRVSVEIGTVAVRE